MDQKKADEPAPGAKKPAKGKAAAAKAAPKAAAGAAPAAAGRGAAKAGRGAGRAGGRGAGRGAKAAAAGAGAPAAGASGGQEEEVLEPAVSFQGTFTKDLKLMMYGHGDSDQPLKETVDLVEDVVLEYVCGLMAKATEHTQRTLKKQVGYEDVLHLVRKDRRKYGRVRELLSMQQEIKDARKQLASDDQMALAEAEEDGGAADNAAPNDGGAALDDGPA